MTNFKNQLLMIAPTHLDLDLLEKAAAAPRQRTTPLGQVPNGTRLIVENLVGPLDLEYSTALTTRLLAHAVAEEVGAVAIYCNSPGGTVSGTSELSEAVARCAARKPVYALCEGWFCSAAYCALCQASRIVASPSCVVGSIGTRFVIWDTHKLFEREGIRVIQITSSEVKGIGEPGVPITDYQVEVLKRFVDYSQLAFESSVSRGRKLTGEALNRVTTGEIWFAPTALHLGLIDEVAILDDAFAKIMSGMPIERYFDLRGADAHSQFMELANRSVCEDDEAACLEDVPAATITKLQKEFPKLTAEARKHEEESRRYSRRR